MTSLGLVTCLWPENFLFFFFLNLLVSSLTNCRVILMVQHRKHFLACSLDFLLWESELLTLNLLSSRPYFFHILYLGSNLLIFDPAHVRFDSCKIPLGSRFLLDLELYFCMAAKNCIRNGSPIVFLPQNGGWEFFPPLPSAGSEHSQTSHVAFSPF